MEEVDTYINDATFSDTLSTCYSKIAFSSFVITGRFLLVALQSMILLFLAQVQVEEEFVIWELDLHFGLFRHLSLSSLDIVTDDHQAFLRTS